MSLPRKVPVALSLIVDVFICPQGCSEGGRPVGGATPRTPSCCCWNRTPLSRKATLGPHLLRTSTLGVIRTTQKSLELYRRTGRNTQLTIGADRPVSCRDKTELDGSEYLCGPGSYHRSEAQKVTYHSNRGTSRFNKRIIYFLFTPLYEKEAWIYIFKRRRGKNRSAREPEVHPVLLRCAGQFLSCKHILLK